MKTIITAAGAITASLFLVGSFHALAGELAPATNQILIPDDLSLDAAAIRSLSTISPAYKEAAARQMLQEVNYFVRQLKLQEPLPVTDSNAIIDVEPPSSAGLGSVETRNFYFSFPGHDRQPMTNGFGAVWFLERGKLAYIKRKNPFARWDDGTSGNPAMFRKLMAMPCRLDTNTAYQLATQWLASVSVDVGELEKKYRPISAQVIIKETFDSLEASNLFYNKKLPIFDVTWGGPEDQDSPPVGIKILGPTKELISLRMEDTRFSKRPPINIPHAEELNAASAKVTTNPTNRIILPRDELHADTNTIKNLFTVSPAYRKAAARQMLLEANYFAQQLKLPESLPITAANATINVNPPRLAGIGSLLIELLQRVERLLPLPRFKSNPLQSEHAFRKLRKKL